MKQYRTINFSTNDKKKIKKRGEVQKHLTTRKGSERRKSASSMASKYHNNHLCSLPQDLIIVEKVLNVCMWTDRWMEERAHCLVRLKKSLMEGHNTLTLRQDRRKAEPCIQLTVPNERRLSDKVTQGCTQDRMTASWS